MPLTDTARNGLSVSANTDGNYRYMNTYSDARALASSAGTGRDPYTVMTAARDSNSMTKIVIPKSDPPPYFFRMLVSEYSRDSWLKIGHLTPSLRIELPIPQSIIDAHNVLWQAEELGITGAVMLGTGDSLAGGARKALSRAAIGVAANLAGQAGAEIGAGFGQGIMASYGVAINNYLTMMLQGPSYKEHEFRWKISPNTPEETEELTKLYRYVNNAQAVGLSPAFGSAFFSYPMIFQLEFYHAEADMGKMLHRFKPCVLRQSAWNFGPSGPAFYGETKGPESVEFSLKFVELEYWLKGDFT